MKIVVIGGGVAGMFSAIVASENKNNEVVLIEKTGGLGNKLKITGKGRCNLTFDGNEDDFKKNIVKNYKFMYSSFSQFNNKDVVEYFNKLGVKTKVERGGRIFPASDDANEVLNALKNKLKENKVKIMFNERVVNIITKSNSLKGIELENGQIIECDKCILSTGGKSYPTTGSTGDGYDLVKKLGHKVESIQPGLIPLKVYGDTCSKLQGLTLKNVKIKALDNERIVYEDFGELLFTHFGLSGPVILSASSKINRLDNLDKKLKEKSVKISIDLKPALDNDVLDKRICRDFEKYANKEFKNSLFELLPQKLVPVVIELSKIDELKKVHQITKEERKNIVNLLKNFEVYIRELMPIDLAVITCGGVNINEINPKTMESKIVNGLYLAGEILDIDAYTGGYNLQIAFSTAYAAGKNV